MVDPKNYYVNDSRLWYEIKLSQGKGFLTHNGTVMLLKIADNFQRKFQYFDYSDTISEDCYQSGVEMMLKCWKNFNCRKYTKALPYMTEVFKRGSALGFNEVNKLKKVSHGSIDDFYNI